MRIQLNGDKAVSYAEQSAAIPAERLDAIRRLGVAAESAEVEFTDLNIQTPWSPPGHYVLQAQLAVEDLLSHFWAGGIDRGCIIPTSHGYQVIEDGSATPVRARGGLWERAMMVFSLDAMHEAAGDRSIARRMAAEWARLKRLYTAEELESAGSTLQLACDDVGWDAMLLLTLYRYTEDQEILDRARNLLNNAFARWLDDELGGGMWYQNERKFKSLYMVGVITAALELADLTKDFAMKDKATGCYRWIESHLLRDDGLYWTDYGPEGPIGKRTPDHIDEAGSVTFLAGNMAMGVLHARYYRQTGDKQYLLRAIRTADAIAAKLSANGIYVDDRDAWTNGAFASAWARDVLPLPGVAPAHAELLRRTADSIYSKARTSRGLYGGSWAGPASGAASRWSAGGSRPEQITTSSSSVMMIVAAAQLEALDRSKPAKK